MVGHRFGRSVAVRVGLWVVVGVLMVGGLPLTAHGPVARGGASLAGGVVPGPDANPPLNITSFSISPNPVDQGSSFSVNVQVSGGTPPYSFNWNPTPPGCSAGNLASWQCTMGQTGSYRIGVTVTDQNGTQVSGSRTLSVTQSGGNGGGGGGGNGSKNNGSGLNLSSFGPFLTYVFVGAIVSFGLLVALTVGVLMIAVILARRLPRPPRAPRGGIVCGSCQATAPAGSKFCPACAFQLPPPK